MTTDNIIPLRSARHQDVVALLPWYVTGAIEPADRAKVEQHLAECAWCRADLASERDLSAAVAELPLSAELGFAQLRRRLEASPASTPNVDTHRPLLRSRHARWSSWAIAAQAAVVLVFIGVAIPAAHEPARYHTLSSRPLHPEGNMVVMFVPGTSGLIARGLLTGYDAQLVRGPTATGAFILSVPADRRAAALAKFRSSPAVVLAQPIDRDQGL